MKSVRERLSDLFRVPEHLPNGRALHAIYVPGYCLTHDMQRLTYTNDACMTEAILRQRWALHPTLIFSCCYDGEAMQIEHNKRKGLALSMGVSRDSLRAVHGIIDTRDELLKLGALLRELEATSVLLIADEYHMPRLLRWARILLPGIEIYWCNIHTGRYEPTWEGPGFVGRLKSIRAGNRILWIAWNFVGNCGTFWLFRKEIRALRIARHAAERSAQQRAEAP